MSADGSVELLFGGDLRKFRLGIDEILALQDRRGQGIFRIVARFREDDIFLQDVQHVIRLGLMGYGVEPKQAQSIVDDHVRSGKLAMCIAVAKAILYEAFIGDPGDPVGKAPAAPGAPEAMTASPPPPSTGQVQL